MSFEIITDRIASLAWQDEKERRNLRYARLSKEVNQQLKDGEFASKIINWAECAYDVFDRLNGLINNPEEGHSGGKYDDVFTLLAPGRQENESDAEFLKRQEDIMFFYERLLQDVVENGVDIREIMREKRQQILDASHTGNVVLSGVKHSLPQKDEQEGIFARDLLQQYFNSEENQSILDLNFEQAKQWLNNIRSQISRIKKDSDKKALNDALDRAQVTVAKFVQGYFDEIASYIDESKLGEYAEAVQFSMLFFEEDTLQMRDVAAVFKFGDVGAGKGTFEKLTNTHSQTFVTGTGGISKPKPNGPYSHLQRLVSGVMPAVNNGGFNPLMDLFALPQILVFRKYLDEKGLPNAPITFDGYPRTESQANMIMSKLAEFFPDRLRVFYMSIDEQTALARILSRIFRGLSSLSGIREDDLAELQFREGVDPDKALNELLETVKRRLLSEGIDIDEKGDWLTAPEFKEIVNKLCNNVEEGEEGEEQEKRYEGYATTILLNPNGRWARYHKKFPEILDMLHQMYPNLEIPDSIDVSNLTPLGVVVAVAGAIGVEATTTDSDIQNKIAKNLDKLLISLPSFLRPNEIVSYLGQIYRVKEIKGREVVLTKPDGSNLIVDGYLATIWRICEP